MTGDVGGNGDLDRPVVLLVDDEAATRRAYARVLDRAGFRTIEAASGSDALSTLANQQVDAVVLDQRMPGMTGLELVSALRMLSAHIRTPVIFVSGDGAPEVRIRALLSGATDFMVKPVVLAELVARVTAHVRLNAEWQRTLSQLSRRAQAVANLAELAANADPAAAAKAICEQIAIAHDGASVSIYEARNDGAQLQLASVGPEPEFMKDGVEPETAAHLRQQIRGTPWVEHESGRSASHAGTWWACAPLRRQHRSLGLLVLGVEQRPGDVGEVDQLLVAAVDYAAVASLQLGAALDDAGGAREQRDRLSRILGEHQFWPVFQPIMSLADRALIGYEALTRFTDGVPPDQRLVDAAEVGFADDMELAMLTAAIDASVVLDPQAWLSCNVSPQVLIGRNAELEALLHTTRRPLVVELTEHSPIDDYPAVHAALAQLGSQVRLSVDDAGAGFASLRHVVDLHPHFLKLDRSWVTGIDHDNSRQALVAGLVGFSTRTGTHMIAEGIETPEELETLVQLGVVYGQGYLLGRPAPASDLTN